MLIRLHLALIICDIVRNYITLAQDSGDIVNSLIAHSDQCGTHDWQVIDLGSNCGNTPCSFPQTWCSNEGQNTCLPLSQACQDNLKKDVSISSTTSSTTTTTSQDTPSSDTTTSSTTTTTSSVTQAIITDTTSTSTESTTTSSTTTTSAIIFTNPPITRPPFNRFPPHLLPVGPNGQLIVLFKQVGDERPLCPDNSNFCCYWARNGQCNDNAYFMQTYCRRSCIELRRGGPDAVGRRESPTGLITIGGDQVTVGENAFGEPPGGTCQNLHPSCELWANRGECKRNSVFMISICRPACGQCPPCLPKCENVCGGSSYASPYAGTGGCQQRCSGCGR